MASNPKRGKPTARAKARAGASEATNSASTVASRAARRAATNNQNRRQQRMAEYEKQRRQWFWTKIGIAAVALVLVGGIGWGAWQQYEQWRVSRDVETYFGAKDFAGIHIDNEPILYEQVPPTGGPHRSAPLWQNCGFYAGYIGNENGVHSLEHGAVWITYDPDLPQDQIDEIKKIAEAQQYILASPYPGMDAPVIASVWGKQIKLDGANDSRLKAFIREYRTNPDNTPEPNAFCWNGVSATTDVVPQQEPYIRTAGSPPIGGITATNATATAQAELGQTPVASPQATPIGTPQATPIASPAATPVAPPASTPAPIAPESTPEASPAASVRREDY